MIGKIDNIHKTVNKDDHADQENRFKQIGARMGKKVGNNTHKITTFPARR